VELCEGAAAFGERSAFARDPGDAGNEIPPGDAPLCAFNCAT